MASVEMRSGNRTASPQFVLSGPLIRTSAGNVDAAAQADKRFLYLAPQAGRGKTSQTRSSYTVFSGQRQRSLIRHSSQRGERARQV